MVDRNRVIRKLSQYADDYYGDFDDEIDVEDTKFGYDCDSYDDHYADYKYAHRHDEEMDEGLSMYIEHYDDSDDDDDDS